MKQAVFIEFIKNLATEVITDGEHAILAKRVLVETLGSDQSADKIIQDVKKQISFCL